MPDITCGFLYSEVVKDYYEILQVSLQREFCYVRNKNIIKFYENVWEWIFFIIQFVRSLRTNFSFFFYKWDFKAIHFIFMLAKTEIFT